MTHSNTVLTKEQKLIKENEIMGKILLEIILKYCGGSYPSEIKTDEEIAELLNREDWKEKNGFSVKENGKIGWRGVHWYAKKPQEVVEELNKEKEILKRVNADFAGEIMDKEIEINELNKLKNYKKIVSEIIKKHYLLTSEEIRTWKNSENKELADWIEKTRLIKEFKIEAEDFGEQVPNWYDDLMEELERGEKTDRIKNIIEHWKERAENAERDNEVHLEALVTAGKERWTQKESSAKEIAEKSEKIKSASENLKSKDELISKLQLELEEKTKKLEEVNKTVKKLKLDHKTTEDLLYLSTKLLPKKPSRIKLFKEKVKTKLQQLIEKTKKQNQELVAQIEVRSN